MSRTAYHAPMTTRSQRLLIVILLSLSLMSCAHVPGQDEYTRWSEAEALFHADPLWQGGDAAASIVLDDQSILWLFGDSFIAPSAVRDRAGATLVRNTVAVQRGHDPCAATMHFVWRSTADGSPRAFLPAAPPTWYWPGGGTRLDKNLLIFWLIVAPHAGDLGFQVTGSMATLISTPDDPPETWKITRHPVPPGELIIGCSGILTKGDHLYAFAAGRSTHDLHLVRWPIAEARTGDFLHPRYWDGSAWTTDPARAAAVIRDGQMEFSVHRDPAGGRYVQVQTRSFMDPTLIRRTAPALTGPWSTPEALCTPRARDGELIYAGRAHPELGDVLSYVVNTFDEQRLLHDQSIYYPVLLKNEQGEPPCRTAAP